VQFPDCYEEAVIKLVHYATLKEEELSQRVVSYFKDRFVAGEVVLGIKDGKEACCKILAALDPAGVNHDCMSPGKLHGSQSYTTALASCSF
jgi:hypothetical protein